jgi:hypothetical protein
VHRFPRRHPGRNHATKYRPSMQHFTIGQRTTNRAL